MNALALGSWSNSVNPNASLMGGFGMMAMNGNSLGQSSGMEMLAASFAMEGMGSGEFAMALMEAGPGGLQCGLFLEALSAQSGECCPSTPAAAADEEMGTCGCSSSSSSSASASASASVSSSAPAPAPVDTQANHGGGGGDGNGGSSSCGGSGDAGSAGDGGGSGGSSGCGGDGGGCGGSCSGGE